MSKARSLVVAGILTAALTIGAVGAGCSDDDDDDGNGGEPVATEVMDETPVDGGEPTEEMVDETPEEETPEDAG